jgi:hypothetical protein
MKTKISELYEATIIQDEDLFCISQEDNEEFESKKIKLSVIKKNLNNPYSEYTKTFTSNNTTITISELDGNTILIQPTGTTGTITIDFDSNWSINGVSTLVTVIEIDGHSVAANFTRIDEDLWDYLGDFETGKNNIVWSKFADGKWKPYRG